MMRWWQEGVIVGWSLKDAVDLERKEISKISL